LRNPKNDENEGKFEPNSRFSQPDAIRSAVILMDLPPGLKVFPAQQHGINSP